MDKMEKLFNDLESLNPEESDRAKKEIADFFAATKEAWIVNGMIDYFSHTNSIRVFEVLVKVQTPHDIHIFNKLQKCLQESNQLQKKTAICLFGHIVRRPPTWLHKIVNHPFHRELLKLLKIEQDVMVLMSGLYCLISLLPIIPQSIMTFLNDLFEISHHLAKMTYHSSNIKECELIHLQYGYYMLFGRLYGMYPCNFTEFLRNEYIVKQDNTPIFNHTIRPLFETFKIHPNLVTSTKSLETNNSRFKKMEPHDVVVECAKYTIEVDRPPPTSSLEYQVYRSPLKPLEYTHLSPELPPLPEPPLYMSAKSVESKIESLLRPSSVVLATPPPTTTVPNTPTPTPIPIPNYGMKQTEQSSPPQLIEAAIEATPETTPMKPDGINQPFRPFPKQNSQTARRIFGVNQSSPSSPLRKDPQQSQFHYATNESENLDITGNHKLMRMMSDRQHHQITEPMMISREDQEVNEINSHNTSNDENGAQEMMDYDETPSTDNDDDVVEDADTTPPLCDPRFYNGGEYVRRVKRLRQYSQCIYSAGTSPASNTSYMIRARSVSRVKRSNSWPNLQESDVVINPTKSKELNGSHQQKTASSSPSDEAISADSHFKKKDQNGNADKVKLQQQQNLFKEIRNDLKSKPLEVVQKASKGTSTVECWPGMSAYDNLFYDAFLSDDLKRKQSNGLTVTTTTTTITEYSHQAYSTVHKPTTSELLDQHIQVALKMKMKPQDYKDHIELLSIQLQFEKYRREIHAERNRRLLGKSRQIRGLEQSNETMSDQVARLSTEITNLNKKAAETRNHYEMQLQKCQNDIKILSKKCNEEMEKNRQLQREKDSLQRKFEEEQQTKCQLSKLNDEMTAKIFDLKSLLEAAQEEAQRGKEYRQQLVKLQSEMIIFNDARVKCKQRMEELNSLKARDEEAEGMYERYSYEIAEIQKKLEMKTSQNDSYRSKICDLEQQLSKKESSIREHKILNVSMIRTYDEKFKALEDKYATQKSIIVKLDEHILELTKNQGAVTLESEKTADLVGCSSPLSISYASSNEFSTSLRSLSDMRNIQPLIVENCEQQSVIYPSTSTSTNSQQPSLQRQQSIHDDATVSSPTKKK